MAAKPRHPLARRLALTGLAEVMLARRTSDEGPERLVVIRRLLPHVRDERGFLATFLQQTAEAAKVVHPNVVQILEVVHDEDECSVTMEYVSGESLEGVLGMAQHELVVPIGVACRIISEAAAGVHAAHRRQPPLLHRDLRPANVLVTYQGNVKVVDFGIAKANVSNVFTRPGTLRFRYGYTAPEILRDETFEPGSDVYSLGVVLWELLAGRRLFDGASPAQVIRAVQEQVIQPPSRFNAAVPEQLDRLVAAALHRDRGERIQSAERLRAELDALLESVHLKVREQEVGAWLSSVLADQREERRAVENEVMSGEATEEDSLDESVPPVARPVRKTIRRPSATKPMLAASSSRSTRSMLVMLLVALLLVCASALTFLLTRR